MLSSSDINKPRQQAGTDHIVSAQSALVSQEKGSNIRASIWGDTIFVDYATRWVKVHLIQDTSGDSTLEAKEYFERDCMPQNLLLKHYHADNGRFAENTFKQDCESKMQHLNFCGVGAHQQNGVSERIIKDLTFYSRTLILHAQHYCTEYITIMIWPFALVASADRMNNLHVEMNGKTPERQISDTIESTTRLSNFHTFGYPVYILDASLQSVGGGGPPKWDPQACLGIYLDHSPSHA